MLQGHPHFASRGGGADKDTPDPPPSKSLLLLGGVDPPPSKSALLLGGVDPPPSKSALLLGGSGPNTSQISMKSYPNRRFHGKCVMFCGVTVAGGGVWPQNITYLP